MSSMAMNASLGQGESKFRAIAPENLLDCVVIERNVLANSVALQNRGYAYMPIS